MSSTYFPHGRKKSVYVNPKVAFRILIIVSLRTKYLFKKDLSELYLNFLYCRYGRLKIKEIIQLKKFL